MCIQCHSWMPLRPCLCFLPCPSYGGPNIKPQLYSPCCLIHWKHVKLRLSQWVTKFAEEMASCSPSSLSSYVWPFLHGPTASEAKQMCWSSDNSLLAEAVWAGSLQRWRSGFKRDHTSSSDSSETKDDSGSKERWAILHPALSGQQCTSQESSPNPCRCCCDVVISSSF